MLTEVESLCLSTIPIDIVEIIVSYFDDEIVIALTDRFPRLIANICIDDHINIDSLSPFLFCDIKCWKSMTHIRLIDSRNDYEIISDRMKYVKMMSNNMHNKV